MLVQSPEGLFMGTAGKADIAMDVNLEPCHKHLIASISKVYTATVTYKLIEQGLISLDGKATDYLTYDWIDRLANADKATIAQLLSHQSGIFDYLQPAAFDLEIINAPYKGWNKEDQIKYALDQDAYFDPGVDYSYSNTNFVLLGMIAEAVSGKPLGQLYREFIFAPLELKNSYYDESDPIPAGTAKGYLDLYTNGNVINNESLYQNELYNADGGIATNVQDMLTFFTALRTGRIISEDSYKKMTDWFPLLDYGDQTANGYGLEYFDSPIGEGFGHTGGIYGFTSIMLYVPDRDMTFIAIVNSIGGELDGLARDLQDASFDLIQ